jgi:hypothetical protein
MNLHNLAVKHLVRDLKIKPGSLVTVISKLDTASPYWQNGWLPEMDKFVGRTCKVLDIDDDAGVYLQIGPADTDEYWFPAFLVQPVSAASTFDTRFQTLMDSIGLSKLVGASELIDTLKQFIEEEKELSWSDGYATSEDEYDATLR